MKTNFIFLSTLFGLLLFSSTLHAQADCEVPLSQIDLDVNNVRARITNAGDLWWDGSDARYIVPKVEPGQGPEVAAIFAGSIWIGGFDVNGNLKFAGQTYGTAQSETDYFAGPLGEDGMTDSDQCENFDKIWATNSTDINSHIQDWTDNGIIDGPVPESLLEWPGRNNPHFFDNNFFDLPDQMLAPFFDANNDGIYDPYDGDYPDINEADQGQWMVFNDAGNIHTQSIGGILGLEIHLLAYAYSSTDEAINNATFYDYTLINKSGEALDSVYAAIWVDADLGCYTDDYVGCSPDKDLAFVYNMDAVDGSSGCNCQGVNTYCDEIPLVGVKILKGVLAGRVFGDNGELENPSIGQIPDTLINAGMSSFMYYRNPSGSPAPPSGMIDPQTPIEFYNLMSGSWRDGLPLTSGGNGYNPGSTDYVDHAFPDNPSDTNGWSMCAVNAPASDPRMVVSSGPFSMEPGAINQLSFTVMYQANVAHPCPDISGLETIADQLKAFYDETVITAIDETFNQDFLRINLFPNPFSEQAFLSLEGANEQLKEVRLYSFDGRLLRTYNQLNSNNLIIERKNLTPGIYCYKAIDKNGKTTAGKFIIQ